MKETDDKLCQCGHWKSKHYHGQGICEAGYAGYNLCQCRKFKNEKPMKVITRDDTCAECGHPKGCHNGGRGICNSYHYGMFCRCATFRRKKAEKKQLGQSPIAVDCKRKTERLSEMKY